MKTGTSIRIYVEVETSTSVSQDDIKAVCDSAISVARNALARLPCVETKYGFRLRQARGRMRRRRYCSFPFPLVGADLLCGGMRKHCTLPEGHEGPHRARDGSELAIVEPVKQ